MNNPTFQGINISNGNVLGRNMKIYKITAKDEPYLKHLKATVNYEKLDPRNNGDANNIFSGILRDGLSKACNTKLDSFLLTCDNVPCGIMVTNKTPEKQVIDYICTWPTKENTKAPLGCKTLFLQIFNNILNSTQQVASLHAIKKGSAISKYLQLGFKPIGGNNYIENMKINREAIARSCENLRKTISLQPTKNTEDIDLFKETNIY